MKIRYLFFIPVIICGCSIARGTPLRTGHLIVRVLDNENLPITNAEVIVSRVIKEGYFAGGSTADYEKTSSLTDSNGVADVCFQFRTSDFEWTVLAPHHHCAGFWWRKEFFNSIVVPSDYLNIDTNTVDGLARYNELKALDEAGNYMAYVAKFEPQSVTYTTNVIYREARGFYPKRNPQPMYAYGEMLKPVLPTAHEVISSNGVEYLKYQTVDFDMKLGAFLPPWGGFQDTDKGEISDFKIVRYSVTTNGVVDNFGWLEFAPGCGAYRCKKTGNPMFPSTYEANSNSVFMPTVYYRYCRSGDTYVVKDDLVPDDEYLVLRTRAVFDDSGTVTNCCYSKILGRAFISARAIHFDALTFNPRANDTNLEFDRNANLETGSRGDGWLP